MRIIGSLALFLVTTAMGLGCEVEDCSDSRSPLTVQFDVAVMVKDSSQNPLGQQSVEADVFKMTCGGDVKRVVGAPWTGTSDPQGAFDVPARVGYTLNDGEDYVEVAATVRDQAGRDFGHNRLKFPYDALSSYAGSVMPLQLTVTSFLQ